MEGFDNTCGIAFKCFKPSASDGAFVRSMKDAGAIPIVRSNVPQLMMLPESVNAIWGCSYNPWNAGRTSGGSSGGEGALVAARCSPLGLGSDIGGSIRIPSHFCGVTGFMVRAYSLLVTIALHLVFCSFVAADASAHPGQWHCLAAPPRHRMGAGACIV